MTAMITALEQVLAKPNLKGLVVVGFEDVLAPVVNKAVAKGIPVVTVDADLPTSKRIAFVGTGNYQAGFQGGKKLAALIGGKGKVALLTKSGQSNLEERIRGYKAALAEFPDITIVQVVDTQSDPTIAAQGAAAVLERNKDLAGLACVEAAGGLGAATAVRERGLAGKVKIVAMDRGNDILGLIGQGVIDATVAQQTALMPYYATQILFNLANHPVAITTDNAKAGIRGVPNVIDTGVVVVDKTNYQLFLRK
jgi:ribose transport system substrate-binding protein